MEIFGEVGAKMGPRWGQVGPKMGHDSAKMTMLGSVGSFWEGPGSIFHDFFRDLGKNGRSVKTTNTRALLLLFWGLGPPPEGPGRAMLQDFGSKIEFS